MPLVRIDLIQGKPTDYRLTISDVVYESMRSKLNVPEGDRFQVITEHPAENFVFDSGYLNIFRTDNVVFIQVTLNTGRSVEMKRAFYLAVTTGLQQRLQIRRQDLFINLVETEKENWSFGNGIAQYAT